MENNKEVDKMNEYVDNEARKARLVGKTVTMAHGAGGRQTSELIDMIFKAHFDNPDLTADDAAVLTPPIGKMAVSTDGFIVSPAFYPGGNIGKLSICGTVNDLSCMGAKPLYLTCAFVIEEGFPMEKLEEIAKSFDGVEKCYAIQAGREIRILVKPEVVKDDEMVIAAREIAKRIESELEYPGQIKVHMIHESRAIDYAK